MLLSDILGVHESSGMVALLIAKYRFFPPQFCTLKTSQIFALPTSRSTFQMKGSSLIKLKIVRGNTLKRRNNAKACFSYENMLLSTRYPQLYSGPAADESIETSSLHSLQFTAVNVVSSTAQKEGPSSYYILLKNLTIWLSYDVHVSEDIAFFSRYGVIWLLQLMVLF